MIYKCLISQICRVICIIITQFEKLFELPVLLLTFLISNPISFQSRNYKQRLKDFYSKGFKSRKDCVKEKNILHETLQNYSLKNSISKIAPSKNISAKLTS